MKKDLLQFNIKKLSHLFLLAFLSFYIQLNAQSFVLDANGQDFNFNNSSRTLEAGTVAPGFTAGSVHRYANVATISGRTLYARVTIVSLSSATITNFDDESQGSATWFQPIITTSAAGFVTYRINFFDTVTNFPVYVYNYFLTGMDVDGPGATTTEVYRLPLQEYTSYTIGSGTGLVVSNIGADTQFRGRTTNLTTAPTVENTATFYANYSRPKTSITFSIGANGALADRQAFMRLGTVPGAFTGTPATTNNTPSAATQTDLVLTQTLSNPYAPVGGTVTFTLNVANNGPATATNVRVGDLLPSGYTFNSATASIGTYTSSDGVWNIGTLTNSSFGFLSITATVNATGNYSNAAGVSGDEMESNVFNNSMTMAVTPTPYDSDGDGISDLNEGCAPTLTMASVTPGLASTLASTNTALFIFPTGSTVPIPGVTITKTAGGNGWGSFTPSTTPISLNINGAQSNTFPTTYLDVVAGGNVTAGVPRTLTIDFGATANSVSTANDSYQYVIGIAGLGNEGASINTNFSVPLTVVGNNNVFSNGRFSLLDGQPATTIGQVGTNFSTSLPNTNPGTAQGYTFFFVPRNVASFIMNITGGNDPHGFIFGVYRRGCTVDTDGDGVLNYLDLDSDNDGITDGVECPPATAVQDGSFNIPSASTPWTLGPGWNIAGGIAQNIGEGLTGSSLSQSLTNLDKVQNGVASITVTIGAQDGNNSGGFTAELDIMLNNVVYATLYNSTARAAGTNNVTMVLASGAYSNFTAFSTAAQQGYTTRTFTLNIPYTGPASAPLAFRMRSGSDDWSVDDVTVPLFFCDFDTDGTFNHLDPDSDNDGCPDAIEGSELVRYNQVYPMGFATVALRGQIRVLGNGDTTGTPSQVISTVAAANGVPLLVNNAVNNTGGVAGVADNTDGSADVGQGIGSSQVVGGTPDPECGRCFRPATTTGTTLPTTHGITALSRAGTTAAEWPGKIKGAYTVLDARTKGFVINRLTTTQINNIATIDRVIGMMVYDTTVNCLKLFDGTGWNCFSKQTCDNFNQ